MEIKEILNYETMLTVLQKFPFKIKRIYYMRGFRPYDVRGKHSHKKTRQIIVCLSGKFNLVLKDKIVYMNSNDYYLLEPQDYHEMRDFRGQCRLLVLASEEYDESDYIR